MGLIQLRMGDLPQKQLNQQQNVKYLKCDDEAKYVRNCSLLSKLFDHIVGETDHLKRQNRAIK